jgi:uncharacterized protein (DUF4415 family)
MKTFLAFFAALLVAGAASAQGAYNIAKQQAQNAVAQEENSQHAISAAAAAPANPPANPALEATLKNISNLRVDLANLDHDPANTQPLANDLTAAAQGVKASPASISKLAGNLAAAVAGNKKLAAQHPRLAQNLHAIFNSSHLSAAQQQTIFDGVQKILLDGGVSADDTAKVVGDLKTIATETK